jgi:hypothetical protein
VTYQPRPLSSGDDLLNSRDQIRTNFEIIRDDFAENHIEYNESGAGKHKFLQMPDQASAPTTAADELGLYSKDVSGVSNLFMRSETDGEEYQVSSVDDANFSLFGTNTTYGGATIRGGWTYLPGGLLMQYGAVGRTTSGLFNVNYPKSFGATPFSLVVSTNQTGTNAGGGILDDSQFQAKLTVSTAATLYWYAIGPA